MNDRLEADTAEALVFPSRPVPPAVVRPREGDVERIVRAAWDAHERDLYALAATLVREREAAADVVGDAFVRLVREVRAGRAPEDVRGWLYRVVGNLVISRGRRLATARRFVHRLADRRVQESPETVLVRKELSPALTDALASLPTDMRVAIVLAARGAAGRDIAAAIGRSEAATRTLLTRARHRLRDRLSAAEGELR